MRKKCLAVLMGVVVLFGSAGVLRASANTLNPTINGISFSAYSRIDDFSASAGTVSGSPYLEVSVSSNYTYINTKNINAGISAYGTQHDSASGKVATTVSFSAPENCRSSAIASYHTASSGSENWSGETSAVK
ncbi:MAG: hypothetical protein NC517_02790 [Firmicutes bacterium]|nr:hypothetical protein [Bacillota bacterium]